MPNRHLPYPGARKPGGAKIRPNDYGSHLISVEGEELNSNRLAACLLPLSRMSSDQAAGQGEVWLSAWLLVPYLLPRPSGRSGGHNV